MVGRNGWFLAGSSALLLAGVWSGLVGCQSEETSSSTGSSQSAGSGGSTGNSMSNGSGGAGGATGGTGGTSATGTGGSGGGAGGGMGGLCDPAGTLETTIEKFTKPTGANMDGPPEVGANVAVQVKGLVATSRLFLVSKSNTTGSCLWGAFVTSPNQPNNTLQPYASTLLVSYGKTAVIPPGQTASVCPGFDGTEPTGNAIPDDLKPGDVLDVIGKTSAYSPSTCDPTKGESSVKQYQISNVKCATRTGTAPVPAAHLLTMADVTMAASQSDKAFYDAWGGAKVRIENVKPVPQMGTGGTTTVVGAFGNITLEGSNLIVGDKVYYVKDAVDKCRKGPVFSDVNMTFNAVEGFLYQNFCTWGLQPNDKCADFDPKSEDCTAATDCSL